jgi:hypothetical protein
MLCHHEDLSKLCPLESGDGPHSVSECHTSMTIGTNDSHKVPNVNLLEEDTVTSHFKGYLG